ncbi:hypothetical protein [Jatrophihabitans fulvus]
MTHTEPQTWSQPYYPAVAPTPAGASFHPAAQPAGARRRVGVLGPLATAVGAGAVLASFVGLPWFDEGMVHAGTDRSGSFSLIGTVISRIEINPNVTVEPVAVHYFSWLSWALLLACFGLALAANVPSRAVPALRLIGALVAAAAVGLTFVAIDLLDVTGGNVPDPPYGEYFGATTVGFWAAVGGFALLGVGALCGTRRSPAPVRGY